MELFVSTRLSVCAKSKMSLRNNAVHVSRATRDTYPTRWWRLGSSYTAAPRRRRARTLIFYRISTALPRYERRSQAEVRGSQKTTLRLRRISTYGAKGVQAKVRALLRLPTKPGDAVEVTSGNSIQHIKKVVSS